MNTIGTGDLEAANLRCRLRPLIPGNCTSRIRQAEFCGRPELKKSSADAKSSTLSPTDSRSRFVALRIESSSSTIEIRAPSDISFPPLLELQSLRWLKSVL